LHGLAETLGYILVALSIGLNFFLFLFVVIIVLRVFVLHNLLSQFSNRLLRDRLALVLVIVWKI